ncbi:hypothetical protein ACTHRI_04780 [Microbacterium algihabitans]|uniref:hypothetical protein n=1 Tax=Microbacterium algihabitans TaxID=3075992 RepID=UPI003F7FFF39
MADLSQFRPGNIIIDEVFFDSASMSETQIDTFLRGKVARCQSGYTCLKDFRQDTFSRGADSYCAAYQGGSAETAARIIAKVADACGINPQVLMVMLEKEQSLVTSTWPSTNQYLIAMGQGCPDTAACDTRYYGFYNQVYGAARQMKIYSANKYFTYYAPGKTWNVRYHPNVSCGSAPVYIENQATANLYYYTPYQPNAAALRAGYGTGDSCSAYGNRNFYSFFTDWFGSTQIARTTLVKLSTDDTVWLINGGRRWSIGNDEDYRELSRVYGAASVVPSSYITAAQYSGAAGAILRDSTAGDIYLIQDGQRHLITSCEAVADLGGSCSAPVDVSSALVKRAAAGPAVGAYFRVRGTDGWGRFEAGGRAVTPLYNLAAVRASAGDVSTTPYAPYLNTDLYAAAPKRPMLFAPAQLVRASNDSRVYMTLDFSKMVRVPSFASVADYNRGPADVAVVAAADLKGYTASGTVSPLLSCGANTYLPAAGWLNRIANPARTGITAMKATAATCAQFSVRDGSIVGDVAVKVADSADVFVLEQGKRRSAVTWAALVAHNGGSTPSITTLAAGIRQAVPAGAPIVTGMVVKSPSSPELLFGGDARVSWIPSAGLASDLGIALDYQVLSASQAASLKKGAALSSWIRCDGKRYIAAEGRLWPIATTAARGFTMTDLEPGACGALDVSTGRSLPVVAVKTSASPDVLVARSGSLHRVTSWDALVSLNGGTAPRILTLSREALKAIPVGAPISR